MSYQHFTLTKVKQDFQLTVIEKRGLFSDIQAKPSSNYLIETLDYNISLALASNTEKSRSELIITPILIEARKQQKNFNFFSGIPFNIDKAKGLNGFCDFIISHSEEQLVITTPIIMLVEAKKENVFAGVAQCIAEMVAAQIFNARENNAIPSIWGTVTTGTNWIFLKLTDKTVEVDLKEYYLSDIEKILGFFTFH